MNLSPKNLPFLLSLISLGLLLLFFQSSVNEPRLGYKGFEKIYWQQLEACEGTAGQSYSFCYQSQPIKQKGLFLELEYKQTGALGGPAPELQVLSQDGARLYSFSLSSPPEFSITPWGIKRFVLPEVESVVLRLLKPERTRTLIRPKASFWENEGRFSRFYGIIDEGNYSLLLSILISINLSLILLNKRFAKLSATKFFLFLLSLAILVHYRTQLFFFWDEWHVLKRFSILEWRGIIYSHNEHFLPLFFSFFLLQFKVFKSSYTAYLAISYIIHAGNAFLLSRVFEQLHAKRIIARILGVLFLISALHLESLQWAFEQSLLISELLFFFVLLLSIKFIRSGRKKDLFVAIPLAAACPLFFGNGFVVPFQVSLLALLLVLIPLRGENIISWKEVIKKRFLRMLAISTILGLSLVPAAYFYLENKDIGGHGVDKVRPFDNLEAVYDYLFVGTQLGSVLRGTGVFPSLDLSSPEYALSSLPPLLGEHLLTLAREYESPAMFFSYLGLSLSLLLLCLYLFSSQRKENLRFFIAGALLLLSCFLLPALARWPYGVLQSLSLRYQYSAWFGLALLYLPLLSMLAQCAKRSSHNLKRNTWKSLLVALLSLHIFSQIYANVEFTHYKEKGLRNRNFLAQLIYWEELLSRTGTKKTRYEGQDTEFHGIFPLYPDTVTPLFHPRNVYDAYQWLEQERR